MYVADEDVAKSPTRVGAFHLDEREGYLSVEERVLSEIDPLLATLAQELLDLVAPASEGGRGLIRCFGRISSMGARLRSPREKPGLDWLPP